MNILPNEFSGAIVFDPLGNICPDEIGLVANSHRSMPPITLTVPKYSANPDYRLFRWFTSPTQYLCTFGKNDTTFYRLRYTRQIPIPLASIAAGGALGAYSYAEDLELGWAIIYAGFGAMSGFMFVDLPTGLFSTWSHNTYPVRASWRFKEAVPISIKNLPVQIRSAFETWKVRSYKE